MEGRKGGGGGGIPIQTYPQHYKYLHEDQVINFPYTSREEKQRDFGKSEFDTKEIPLHPANTPDIGHYSFGQDLIGPKALRVSSSTGLTKQN
ncbi:hypothetical protein RRG08_014665 [Elysia crispata]|uniref:Uncharacterized protein n=1 Tax=Elysia crispata TaxID=231223 RepID=A0AAE1CZN7_9GAST|nr:hypothetical protein RRG08_014665 [Elysia crispata]